MLNKLGYFSIIKTERVWEKLAHKIARLPQTCVQADRKSVYAQEGLSMLDALKQEWFKGKKHYQKKD